MHHLELLYGQIVRVLVMQATLLRLLTDLLLKLVLLQCLWLGPRFGLLNLVVFFQGLLLGKSLLFELGLGGVVSRV